MAKFFFFLHLTNHVCLFVCVTYAVLPNVESQETTCISWFATSTLWGPRDLTQLLGLGSNHLHPLSHLPVLHPLSHLPVLDLSPSTWMFICLMNECFSQSQETAAHLTSDWASLDRQVWERLLWLTVAVLTCLLASLPLTASLPEP